ncbi:MAG: preprotein translocase subunit SecG [Bacteroidota bacterium]
MGTFLIVLVLIIIACILMVLVVLVQNSKGGGLASGFSSSNQIMGVRKTADLLEKSTWTLAIVMVTLSLFSVMVLPKHTVVKDSDTELRERLGEKAQPVKDYQTPPGAKK